MEVPMITCLGRSSIRGLLAACARAAMIGAQPPAHADGGGTFSLYDADRNGSLDRQEFDTFVAAKRNRADIAEVWTFQRVDAGGDGRVSEQEMIDALLADIRRRQP
jgi:hypothetical protein